MKSTTCLYLLTALLAAACVSRYRLDLYVVQENHRQRVKVEKTEVLMDSQIGDPYASRRLDPGTDNVLVLTLGARGESIASGVDQIFGFDEYYQCQVFLQLPSEVAVDTLGLADRSFVRILGRYEVPAEDKVYLSTSGDLFVDSLTSKYLYVTLDGDFQNRLGANLGVEGQFRAKVRDLIRSK